ncbi:MAG: 4-hydroxy-tetrahydrodipicolinate reductase, partial [Spirochaetales bacterium]
MNIVLVGYGNMGREVEKILLQRNHRVTARVDTQPGCGDTQDLSRDLLEGCDGVIEFSLPGGVLGNIRRYAEAGIPAVIGTTGWEKDKDAARDLILSSGTALVWGYNFSIGAHLFFSLVGKAAALIDSIPDYDIFGYEIHHSRKKDSPSGTALTMAGEILANTHRKKVLAADRMDRQIKPEELHIGSVRGGSVPGIHTVMLDSAADTIEITNNARNRGGFALGAVMAAEWLQGKKGFF